MDWRECNEKEFVKKIIPDNNRVTSLIKSSRNKAYTASIIPMNDRTSSSIISLYYDSLRELLEAIAIKSGYKIYNHECFSCFLKEILNLEEFSIGFDSLRRIRNSINYYGETLSISDVNQIIKELKSLINELSRVI